MPVASTNGAVGRPCASDAHDVRIARRNCRSEGEAATSKPCSAPRCRQRSHRYQGRPRILTHAVQADSGASTSATACRVTTALGEHRLQRPASLIHMRAAPLAAPLRTRILVTQAGRY